MGIISFGDTNIGKKRSTNQDSIYYNNDLHLYVVADGMGGHNGGDIASKLAVESVAEYVALKRGKRSASDLIKEAILEANFKIYQMSLMKPELKGMGTTLVILYFEDNQLFIGNVGDSRAYLIKEDYIYQLTRDHSLIQEKINLGIYTREQADNDQQKNVLVRAVGHDETVVPDLFTFNVSRNDFFFICSDGLHGKVDNLDMLKIINQNLKNETINVQVQIEQSINNLIQGANDNGGNDNISVIACYTI